MRLRSLVTMSLAVLAVPLSSQEATVVANEWYEVEILRVEQVDSLHGGMVRPDSANDAFLMVYLETEDPCFDPQRNHECFDAALDELEKLAWACGHVVVEGDELLADGGGVLEEKLACSFVVEAGTTDLTLVLRDYPAVELRARDSS